MRAGFRRGAAMVFRFGGERFQSGYGRSVKLYAPARIL